MGFILCGGNFRKEDKSAKNAKITPTRKFPRLQQIYDLFCFYLCKPLQHSLPTCTICYVFREDGTVKFLTKGDNNSVDDRGLYAPGQLWLEKKDVVGRARGLVSSHIIIFISLCQ